MITTAWDFSKKSRIPNLHVQHVLARGLLEDRSDNTLPQWRENRQQHWHHLDVVLLLRAMLTLAQNDAKKHMDTYGVFWIMWPSRNMWFPILINDFEVLLVWSSLAVTEKLSAKRWESFFHLKKHGVPQKCFKSKYPKNPESRIDGQNIPSPGHRIGSGKSRILRTYRSDP